MTSYRPAARVATRIAFFVAGFGAACWASLVPFVKQRAAIDEATLGALLLCVGAGSVIGMMLTGTLGTRFGSKPIVFGGGVGLAVILPLLAIAHDAATLGIALFGFGAALGSLDVAMNINAVEVERVEGRRLMSGFHAQYSMGGFGGSALATFLLAAHAGVFASMLLCSALMFAGILIARRHLIETPRRRGGPLFAVPRGIVLLLAGLVAISFLLDGVLLSWGALFISGKGLVPATQGGLGYMLFSIAMMAGRLSGDTLTTRIGDRSMMFWGGSVATAGMVVLLVAPIAPVALAGFPLIGLGASNVVPIMFRRAGAQRAMSPSLAVVAITMTGYAGNLVGPASIGFIADQAGLSTAFWLLAGLVCLIPCCAGFVTHSRAARVRPAA
ncbi:MFS transporter [Burkholderia orbicola]|uniref:MFS transporter n=1 Tax=Burkholderia orbicola TaxID=2978683 RepID=UPI001903F809|nr:MFS transporter [Burkholderia orbicola]MBK1824984.1 MFS transporter [Burkholderia orbicola]